MTKKNAGPAPTEESKIIDERLSAIERTGMLKTEIAAAAGASAPEIYQWRTARRPVPWQRAERLGKVIDADPALISKEYAEMKASAADDAAPPSGIFTKERRANDDVVALQIGLESLFLAVLQRTPGAASTFLEDVEVVASSRHFSTKAGFLGGLVGIARRVRRTEEEADQARRRAGSAVSTRRGKKDPAQ